MFRIFLIYVVGNPPGLWFIVLFGPLPAVIDSEFKKIGEDGDIELQVPAVTSNLERGVGVLLDFHGRPLGLDSENVALADLEDIVGRFPGRAAYDGMLAQH